MNPQKPSGPVMDIQRPRPNPAPSQVTTPLDNPMAPADSIASVTPDPGQIVGSPLAPTQPMVNKPKPKRTGLIVGLITAAVVLLIGAGVGGFIWYKTTHKPAPAATTTETQADRVDVEEIDSTLANIDKTLNTLDDTNDITTNEVQDAPLGL